MAPNWCCTAIRTCRRSTGSAARARHQVPVVGVAAAGQAVGGRMPAAQWNLLEISGEPGAWALRLTAAA